MRSGVPQRNVMVCQLPLADGKFAATSSGPGAAHASLDTQPAVAAPGRAALEGQGTAEPPMFAQLAVRSVAVLVFSFAGIIFISDV
jgi:hypothetical protein